MDLGIEGKWALVLGASQGIGAAIARALGEERCNVIIGARNSDEIRTLASEIRTEYGVEAVPHAIDLTDAAAVAELCHKIEHDWEIDILLNNTGGPPPSGSVGVSDDVWSKSLQGLLMSVIRLTESAIKGMAARRWPSTPCSWKCAGASISMHASTGRARACPLWRVWWRNWFASWRMKSCLIGACTACRSPQNKKTTSCKIARGGQGSGRKHARKRAYPGRL